MKSNYGYWTYDEKQNEKFVVAKLPSISELDLFIRSLKSEGIREFAILDPSDKISGNEAFDVTWQLTKDGDCTIANYKYKPNGKSEIIIKIN